MAYLRKPTEEEQKRISIPPCEKAEPRNKAFYDHWRKDLELKFLGVDLSREEGPYQEVLLQGNIVLGWNGDSSKLTKLVSENPWQSDQIYAAAAYLVTKENPRDYSDILAENGIL